MGISLILAAAGEGRRFAEGLVGLERLKKQWILVHGMPLWQRVYEQFVRLGCFERIIVVVSNSIEQVFVQQRLPDACVVVGGQSRQESVQNALEHVSSRFVVVSDVARFGLDLCVLAHLFETMQKQSLDGVAPAVSPNDTLVYGTPPWTLNRQEVRCVQTPQICLTSSLKRAYALGHFTDESSALLHLGAQVEFIEGSTRLHKLTHRWDLAMLAPLIDPPTQHMGLGFDVHAFEAHKPLKLGGVLIDPADCSHLGLRAHSDGDVLLHALSDALLGAIKGGDIGMYYSDQDPRFKNMDSVIMLQEIYALLQNMGYIVQNVDLNLLAEIPKIAPYRGRICQNIARLLHAQPHQVNLKATTLEGLGFIGRKEGMGAQAVVQITTRPIDLHEKS
ncbi:2-C-methyl-D-erythritol 2,4-cyclodiphosphate synthase [Helicobacter cynogastricus]|uniref:2-C-methyl-D-erythritol 2,4-cyclodiphosphate synthase n=1 Tax=Helicobacter cynogastricus TaxID=329937 RepID=UPI000CF0B3CF|nr:2-C-methyl-D-erythritol 2,4-cyclodiphosphate synthase [Helicobacter cynogastricus]